METRMRNLDHRKVLYIEERGIWSKHGDRTQVHNQTILSSALPMIFSAQVEKFSVRKYDENGEKQRMGMLSVLEMLREKYTPSATDVVDIGHGVHLHSMNYITLHSIPPPVSPPSKQESRCH